MTRVLGWLTMAGGVLILLGLVAITIPFVNYFGPILNTAAFFVAESVVVCFVVGAISMGRNDAFVTWRSFYLMPALLFGFAAYCGTGFRWIEDRANMGPDPHRLENYIGQPPPQVVAAFERDMAIAKAKDGYEMTMARLGGEPVADSQFPRSATPWLLYGLSFMFTVVALLPRRRIQAVLVRLHFLSNDDPPRAWPSSTSIR